jgi:hypothetical protein
MTAEAEESSMPIHYPGQGATLEVDFKVSGTLTDPTTISLLIKDPDGQSNTYTYAGGTVTKDGTGEYSKAITLEEEGVYRYRWVGTGTVVAATEGEIIVASSEFV